jgi:hypothetical protein
VYSKLQATIADLLLGLKFKAVNTRVFLEHGDSVLELRWQSVELVDSSVQDGLLITRRLHLGPLHGESFQ